MTSHNIDRSLICMHSSIILAHTLSYASTTTTTTTTTPTTTNTTPYHHHDDHASSPRTAVHPQAVDGRLRVLQVGAVGEKVARTPHTGPLQLQLHLLQVEPEALQPCRAVVQELHVKRNVVIAGDHELVSVRQSAWAKRQSALKQAVRTNRHSALKQVECVQTGSVLKQVECAQTGRVRSNRQSALKQAECAQTGSELTTSVPISAFETAFVRSSETSDGYLLMTDIRRISGNLWHFFHFIAPLLRLFLLIDKQRD